MSRLPLASAIVCLACAIAPLSAQPKTPPPKPTPIAWRPTRPADLKLQTLAWLASQDFAPATRIEAASIWSNLTANATEDDLLDRLAQTYACINADAAKLVAICSQPRGRLVPPDAAWLRDLSTPPLLANNLRLFYATWLVRASLFDEAAEQLVGLDPSDVAAPATLLFNQSVVAHALLTKEAGLRALDALLAGDSAAPRRYLALARLMREDLGSVEDDSLDHIARRMEDIRRRLDLGRAGPKVRGVEKGVVESLDKLIKKLEDEQKKQQSADAGTLRPQRPADESRPMGGKGPGHVTKKYIGSQSGWGDLPPKERDNAMQQVGRDFPSHYRDAIEQYFKRLATENEK
jgi:hypothetical protein